MTATSAVAAWRAWHEELEADRTAPHGSLAATALHWIDETPTRLDDLPGVWRLDGGVPVVELDDGDALILDDDTHGDSAFRRYPTGQQRACTMGRGRDRGRRAGR